MHLGDVPGLMLRGRGPQGRGVLRGTDAGHAGDGGVPAVSLFLDGMARAGYLWLLVHAIVSISDTGAVRIVWPMWVFFTASGLFGLGCARFSRESA